ncbi:ADP-ribosylation factor [Hondaea fermentalgiana]|uniref:ADP-ribosylation factor n=1 Tax=Hondaea fermentalgiana TaxID=2315210 RepID=A0A2R5GG87_9STRA|nr:ADP-ribosylation factor [Hondaea fermentalgiana]|eukprot:GBG29897.1 ADP-ribosylation factor [Hondaea fermentalgiana]
MGICGSSEAQAGGDTGNRKSLAITALGHAKGRRGPRYETTAEFAMGLPQDEESRARGMYLVFDSVSGGTLYAVWSETVVEGAWAFFFPRKDVAAFKFKGNGRSELIRGLMVNRQKLYSGWTQFFKLANDNDGLIKVFTNRDVEFWYMDADLGVHFVEKDVWCISHDMTIVAILPHFNQSLKGVRKTSADVFTDTVVKNGGTTWHACIVCFKGGQFGCQASRTEEDEEVTDDNEAHETSEKRGERSSKVDLGDGVLGWLGIYYKNAKILFLGLDNAGKTTLLHMLKDDRVAVHTPTLHPNHEELVIGNVRFQAHDLGGHEAARKMNVRRKLWKDFFTTVDGVVYIVDALDRERFPEAKKELDQLLTDEMLSNTPFLVLGNKIDLPAAVGEDELRQQLGLTDTFGKDTKPDAANGVRPIELFMCSVVRKAGIQESFQWLSQFLN